MISTVPTVPEDEPFLYEVYAATRREEFAPLGWSPEQEAAFLRMQFQMQRRAYEQYEGLDSRLIIKDGRRIGRILVSRTGQEIRLVDISLLPEERNSGVGAELIRELQAEASVNGKPLRLSVFGTNPARRLYERLGFQVTGDNGMYLSMEWRAE